MLQILRIIITLIHAHTHTHTHTHTHSITKPSKTTLTRNEASLSMRSTSFSHQGPYFFRIRFLTANNYV
jgi:hypothetical protein